MILDQNIDPVLSPILGDQLDLPITRNLILDVAGFSGNLAKSDLVVESSNVVSQWNGINGISLNPSQAVVGERPLYVKSAINGLPALQFDGIDDSLTLGSDYLFSTGSGLTIIALAQSTTAGDGDDVDPILDFGGFAGAGYGVMLSNGWTELYTATFSGGARTGLVFPVANNDPHIIMDRVIFGDKQEIFIDNPNTPSNTHLIPSLSQLTAAEINEAPTRGVSSGPVSIGRLARDGFPPRRFKGFIGEIIIYDTALTDIELHQIYYYLSAKWKIT